MRRQIVFGLLGFIAMTLIGCSKAATGTLGCTASGTVISGNASTVGSTVQLSSVVVNITNGSSAGPFNITFPGVPAVSSTTPSYTYPGNLPEVISSAGVISAPVTIVDSGNSDASATCNITLTNAQSGAGGTASVTLTASSTNPAVNTPVTLTASAPAVVNPVYTFSQTPQVNGVVLTPTSATTDTLTSSIAQTVTVTVTVTSTTDTTVSGTASATVTFGGTGTGTGTGTGGSGTLSGSMIVSVPNPYTSVGGSLVVSASDPVNPSATYAFSLPANSQGITISQSVANSATVTSQVATVVQVNITEFAPGTSTVIGTGYASLNFTGVGGGGGVTGSTVPCTLTITPNPSSNYIYVNQVLTFSVTSSYGATQVTYWDPGEPYTTNPIFPLPATFTGSYQYSGYKNFRIDAQLFDGRRCTDTSTGVLSFYYSILVH